MRRVMNLLITLTALAASGVIAQEPPANRVHRVQAGETLSSIARAYFGDTGTWRAIYEANRAQISNPNRIEPGLELTIPAGAGTIRSVEVTTTARGGSTSGVMRTMPQQPTIQRTAFWSGPTIAPNTAEAPLLADAEEVALLRPTVPNDAFYSAGWLLHVDEIPHSIGFVESFSVASGVRSQRTTAVLFDRLHVIVDDAEAVRPGDRLTTFRVERELKDVGSIVVPTGMLEIEGRDESGVVGVVIEEYEPIQLGDLVEFAKPFPLVAGERPADVEDGIEAHIVTFERNHELQLLNDIVFIDKGSNDGIAVGDEFHAYAVPEEGWAPESIGRLQIVGVRDDRASARILSISTPAFAEGLVMKMSRRMP